MATTRTSQRTNALTTELSIVQEYGNFTTVNGGAPTTLAGCIATCTRTGEGTFTGTFKRKYPQVRSASVWPLVAGGGKGVFTALDPVAGTFGILLSLENGTADDLPTAVVRIRVDFADTTVTRR
jgi:hypothetical protein